MTAATLTPSELRTTPASWLEQTWTLTTRTLHHWRAEPMPFLVNLLFPALTVLMMGGLFGGAIAGSVGDYIPFVIPGVLTIAMLFGLESTVLAMTTDAGDAITDRLRSLPLAASAVLAGRALADLIASLAGLVVTSAVGLALGWRWENGLWQAMAAYGLLVWLRIARCGSGSTWGSRHPDRSRWGWCRSWCGR